MGRGPWAKGHGPGAMGHGPGAMGRGPWAGGWGPWAGGHGPGASTGRRNTCGPRIASGVCKVKRSRQSLHSSELALREFRYFLRPGASDLSGFVKQPSFDNIFQNRPTMAPRRMCGPQQYIKYTKYPKI